VIESWLTAVRDHPERPAAHQCHVLTMLALRMDWKTGCGFASTGQLVADAEAAERTVRRATSWARRSALLLQTRRGHRLGNGQVAASEWQLTQPATPDLLTSQPANGATSTGQSGHLNRPLEHHHQDLSSSRSSTSGALALDVARRTCPQCGRVPETGHLPLCPAYDPFADPDWPP
jgi:hypothetical protein